MPLSPQQELRLLRVIEEAQAAGDVQGELRALRVMDEADAPTQAPSTEGVGLPSYLPEGLPRTIGQAVQDTLVNTAAGPYGLLTQLMPGMRDEAVIGAGRGFTNVGEGAKQLAFEAADAATGLNVADAYTQQVQAERDAYSQTPVGQSTTGAMAEFAAENTPFALIPGASLPAAVATGTAIGGVQFVPEGESRAVSALEGGAGGLLGNLAGRGIAKAISPLAARADEAAREVPAIESARRLGFQLTPSQQVDNARPGWFERTAGRVPIVRGAVDRLGRQNQKLVNQIAARSIGSEADRLTPRVLNEADERIGKVFDDIAAKGDIRLDDQFIDDLAQVEVDYGRSLVRGDSQIVSTIENALEYAKDGRVRGRDYLNMVSDLRKVAEGKMRGEQSNPAAGRALFAIKEALDNAMERTLGKADRARLQKARSEYRSLMQLLRPGVIDGGDVSAVKLGNFLKRRDVKGYTLGRNESDLYEVARVARDVRDITPNSGTPQGLMEAVTGTALGGSAIAPFFSDLGLLSATAAPAALLGGRGVTSAWMRGGANRLMSRPGVGGGTIGQNLSGLTGRVAASENAPEGILNWLQDAQENER